MTERELMNIKLRITAAKRVMLFFKQKLKVYAANNPFRLERSVSEDILGGARMLNEMKNRVTHASVFDLTAQCHLGNCRELNSMAYMLIKTQQIINTPSDEHNVHLVVTNTFDHVFVVICDKKFLPGTFNMQYLGKTCVVIDRWTNDYYTPNLSICKQIKNNIVNIPNPYQLYIRRKILSNRLKASDNIPDM